MTLHGPCKLLKIYVNEDTTYEKHSLYKAIVLRLKELHMAGVTVTRGLEGFGQAGRLHSANILDLSLSLPIVIDIVDTDDKITLASQELRKLVGDNGLMFVCDVNVLSGHSEK